MVILANAAEWFTQKPPQSPSSMSSCGGKTRELNPTFPEGFCMGLASSQPTHIL